MQVRRCATKEHSDGTMASRNKQLRILFPSVESIRVSLAILFMAGCGSVAVALPQAVPANTSGAESPIAIIHVTVIDTKTGGEANDRTVVISDGRILSMKDNKTSRLPPFAALQTATWDPAVFMEATDRYGSIQEGKLADLILLDADPSKDIHNTTKIFAVFFEGRKFDRAALDQLLRTAEENAMAIATMSSQ